MLADTIIARGAAARLVTSRPGTGVQTCWCRAPRRV